MLPFVFVSALTRLAELRDRLRNQPRNSMAWYWELQIGVIASLTALYGNYGSASSAAAEIPVTGPWPRNLASGTKTREEIGAILRHIADVNRTGQS